MIGMGIGQKGLILLFVVPQDLYYSAHKINLFWVEIKIVQERSCYLKDHPSFAAEIRRQ